MGSTDPEIVKAAVIIEQGGVRMLYWFDPAFHVRMTEEVQYYRDPWLTDRAVTSIDYAIELNVTGMLGGGVIWDGDVPGAPTQQQIEAQRKELGS